MGPEVTQPKRSGGTVTAACKLPHGLQLRLYRMVDAPMVGPVGVSGTEKRAQPVGEPVVIRGMSYPVGQPVNVPIIGGYALTPGIDADFWDAWLKANADMDAVRNGLLFAHARHDHAEGMANEKAALRSGLEAIDPEKPGRGIERAKAA
jgi:hypothetical protein